MKEFIENDIVVVKTSGRLTELQCPRCGGLSLHQNVIQVFHRSEDDPKVWKTVITENSVETKLAVSLTSDNPSPRRQGMTISFSCEDCGIDRENDVLDLHLYQHKGSTVLRWRYAKVGR